MAVLTVVVPCFCPIGGDRWGLVRLSSSSSFSWYSAVEVFVRFVVAVYLAVVAIVVVIVMPGRHLLEVVLLKSLPNDVDVDVAFARGYFVSPSGLVATPPFAAAGWIPAWCYHHPWRRSCNLYYWRVVSRSLKLSPQRGGACRYG